MEDNAKLEEIRRLRAPLKFKGLKAYDSKGNLLKCIESSSKVQYMLNPKSMVLSDDEILQYAPRSKEAARVRLSNGNGDFSDKLLINNSLPWFLGLYYVSLICFLIVSFIKNFYFGIFIGTLLIFLPLIYLLYVFVLKTYNLERPNDKNSKKDSNSSKDSKSGSKFNIFNHKTNDSYLDQEYPSDSFLKCAIEVNELKEVFDEKEKIARDLVDKRFEPPQITHDKFMAILDNFHKLFYTQVEAALEITKLTVYSNKGELELKEKIKVLKRIIEQIDDLIGELVINSNSIKESDDEIKDLFNEMDDLINSIKNYE